MTRISPAHLLQNELSLPFLRLINFGSKSIVSAHLCTHPQFVVFPTVMSSLRSLPIFRLQFLGRSQSSAFVPCSELIVLGKHWLIDWVAVGIRSGSFLAMTRLLSFPGFLSVYKLVRFWLLRVFCDCQWWMTGFWGFFTEGLCWMRWAACFAECWGFLVWVFFIRVRRRFVCSCWTRVFLHRAFFWKFYFLNWVCSFVNWVWWLRVGKSLVLLQDRTFFSWPVLSWLRYRVFLWGVLIVLTFQGFVLCTHWRRLVWRVGRGFVFWSRCPGLE
jgi:hypothetical protein